MAVTSTMSAPSASPSDTPGDPRLGPFLHADTEQAAQAALADLLGELEALVTDVVGRALRGSRAGATHVDDVAADVRLRLVRRLWALRDDHPAGEPIANLAGYVTTVAQNTCDAFFRHAFPNRTRFRNRARYALAHHPQTLVEDDAQGRRMCATRRAVRAAAAPGAADAFLADPGEWLAARGIAVTQPLPALLDALLAALDRPIEFDRLVGALAGPLGIEDTEPAAFGDESRPRGGAAEPRDPSPDAGDVMLQREALARAWREIVALPPRQRAALLLNLRDAGGSAVIHLLPGTLVASLDEIAAALDMTQQNLDDLWALLPLDDLAVAARMGVTRQQVINLRKAARARLARRLARD